MVPAPLRTCRILLTLLIVGTFVFTQLGTRNVSKPFGPDVLDQVRPQPKGQSRSPPPTQPLPKIAGFYHFWYGNQLPQMNSALAVFEEQMSQVLDSYTYDKTSTILLNLVGKPDLKDQVVAKFNAKLEQTKAKAVLNFEHQERGFEDVTLRKLYGYCAANPDDLVWYIHNKGAWHAQAFQPPWRRSLTNFAMRKECLDTVLDGHDVCGFRFIPFPHRHYPGNMWIARCSYIKTLSPTVKTPSNYVQCDGKSRNFTVVKNGTTTSTGCLKYCWTWDRFFHEHWIGSNPYGNISDCLGYTQNDQGVFHTYFGQYGPADWETIPVMCSAAPKKVLVDAWMKDFNLIPNVNPWSPAMFAVQRDCAPETLEADKLFLGTGS